MQINPLNQINLILPVAQPPAVAPSPSVGARNQADTAQAGTSNSRGAVYVKPRAGEVKIDFPADRSADAEETLQALEEAVRAANIALNFSRDEETGTIVVKLVDQTSGETVQQIPSEALLHLSATLGKLQGQLFDQEA